MTDDQEPEDGQEKAVPPASGDGGAVAVPPTPLAAPAPAPEPEAPQRPHIQTLQRGTGAPLATQITVKPTVTALPHRLRGTLRDSYTARIPFLEGVIDGTVRNDTRVKLKDIAPHLACMDCGGANIAPMKIEGEEASIRKLRWELEIRATASAPIKDRIAAMGQLAQYGLGQLTEVSTEAVRAKVAETVGIIRKHCDDATTGRILAEMRKVWAG